MLTPAPPPAISLRKVAVKDLVANRLNVREHLEGIDELAASIRSNGLLQPLIVNDRAGQLVVTDGHRRLEAARRALMPHVMCLVTTDADARSVTTTMLAAAMHKELRPLEQARAFKSLRDQGLAVIDIARSTGYSTALISQRLLLLELPAEAQDMVDDNRLTLGQAKDLAKQVRRTRSGSAGVKVAKRQHFVSAHSVSAHVVCHHHETRYMYGGIGCGPCWETAIRANERQRIARETQATA